jgi:hypothetical protein
MWNGLLQSYDFVLKQVGNFRVEPPGLFRGRGDHPKVQSSFHFFICFLVMLFLASTCAHWAEADGVPLFLLQPVFNSLLQF